MYSAGNSNAEILLPLRFGKSFASERTLTHGWHGSKLVLQGIGLRILRSALESLERMKAHWLLTSATTATPNVTTIQAELEASLWLNCTWRIAVAVAFSLASQKVVKCSKFVLANLFTLLKISFQQGHKGTHRITASRYFWQVRSQRVFPLGNARGVVSWTRSSVQILVKSCQMYQHFASSSWMHHVATSGRWKMWTRPAPPTRFSSSSSFKAPCEPWRFGICRSNHFLPITPGRGYDFRPFFLSRVP